MRQVIPLKIAAFQRDFILKILHRGGDVRNCKFGTPLGETANDLMKVCNFNCTVVETEFAEGYGHLDVTTGKYNGMNGAVQSGEVDFGLATQMVPMEKDDFLYDPILTYSRITILSSYAKHDPSKDKVVTVADVFDQISPNIFIIFALFLLLFFFLLAVGKKLLKSTDSTNSAWTIATFTCNQGSFDDDSKKFYLLFTSLLCLFIFWFYQYFGNFMATELVRPHVPKIIDTFDDILHYRWINKTGSHDYMDDRTGEVRDLPKLLPRFLRAIRSINYFQRAPTGSVYRRIFDQAIEMNGDISKSQVDVRESLESGVFVASGRHVYVDAETILRMIRVTMCDLFPTDGSLASRAFRFAQSASIPYKLGYVYSRNISTEARKRLDNALYAMAESGVAHQLVSQLSTAIISKITHKIRMCMRDDVDIIPPYVVQPLGVLHIIVIFKAIAVAFSVAIVINAGEIYLASRYPIKSKRTRRVRPATCPSVTRENFAL